MKRASNTRHLRKLGLNIIDALRSTTRLPRVDRPIMAANLGRIAADLRPDTPLQGAREMFHQAWPGQEAKWDKRKRLLRLPGEPASNPGDDGAYDATGAAYLRLAEAAAEIRNVSVDLHD